MMRKCFQYIRKHLWIVGCVLMLLVALTVINVMAYCHAYSMTHFVEDDERSIGTGALSAWQKMKVLLVGFRIPKPFNFANPRDRGLEYNILHFSGPSGIKYEAWYIPCEKSRGLCIVFHGLIGCKAVFLSQACAWHELGYDVLSVDFRGCGGSSGHVTTIGYLEADDVVAACKYAEQELGVKKPILWGMSMGAVAILRAASRGNIEARALVLECPFASLLTAVKHDCALKGIPSFPAAQLLVFWGGVQHGFSGFKHNPVEYARTVRLPALLMHGDQDPLVTTQEAQSIGENLAGEKQFVLFANTGHQPYVTTNEKQWRQVVTDFLEKHR